MTTFPGGTSASFLAVYPDAAPDGICGGSPHLHTASTECYATVGGRGELHSLTSDGYAETLLEEGTLAWFTPGTIHRAVNRGGLRVVVLMSNAGLPESGDAVMTFPREHLADAERYRAAAELPAGAGENELAAAAARRRDLAVEGYLPIRDALRRGDDGPLREFRDAATALVADRLASWEGIVRDGPLAQAEEALGALARLSSGDAGHLADAAVFARAQPMHRFGMCGRLRAFDTSG